ncbi:hypothetical protein KUCAC02_024914 [Chaenocephalus aceratus]|nr:hypothetical protein KUCAC02_032867 [Chaenocephalus aceratus]KAI4797699.1 hypothetical protein KUCAC02_024914 [Chaenocephalus aceratus]
MRSVSGSQRVQQKQKEAEFPAVRSGGRALLTPRNPERNTGGSGENRVHKAGVEEPPATGMARDYDYLFKLLIIGDSGKETPGMRDGK